jgi:hypothetical protein
MVRGCLPTQRLLQGIQLEPHYWPLVIALKSGNLKLFEERLMERAEFFRSKGLFVILKEKCQLVMFRNLIYKAYVFDLILQLCVLCLTLLHSLQRCDIK